MIYFSVADGFILAILVVVLSLILAKMIKNRKLGSCSSCYVYKQAKRKQHGMIDFYNKIKDQEK
jgi:hypothetical protein